jgi:two-component system response regulator AtoC
VSARAAEEAERKVLGRVLAETRWNRREAAAQLKISYKALLNKIKKWEVEPRGPEPPPAEVEAPMEAVPDVVIRPRGAWRRPAVR